MLSIIAEITIKSMNSVLLIYGEEPDLFSLKMQKHIFSTFTVFNICVGIFIEVLKIYMKADCINLFFSSIYGMKY